ncbi:MAG: hypothetical protein K9M49_09890 [Candidatus Marinimicrobia bacterium]|nr:hypothetical protein [Candidatus Neomarinimicrobiota bacterium]MCF7905445.1 hypothetical protein [Candidatus Neomarinimicrobiota bacterium]
MKTRFITIAVLATTLIMSCSTLSFIPTEGGASKFNLATVEYVQSRNAQQEAEIISNLSDHIVSVIDSLLTEDRASLDAFTDQLNVLDSALMVLSARIDTTEMMTDRSMALMSKELTSVKTNASSTRMVIRRINDNIDNLPLKALETFNEAIDAYLHKDDQEAAPEE